MSPAKPDPNASSSDDLAQARRLSQQLVPHAPAAPSRHPPSAPPVAPEGYARFGVAPRRLKPVEVGGASWQQLLTDVMGVSGAFGAFAIDETGLPVASSGRVEASEVERLGSRLSVAVEHLERMADAPPRTVCIDLGDRHLTVLRLRTGESPITVVLLTRAALPEATRVALGGMLAAP